MSKVIAETHKNAECRTKPVEPIFNSVEEVKENIGRILAKPVFSVNRTLEDIKNSMELDSQTIASIAMPNGDCFSLEVCGEVSVFYDGKVYTAPSDFPEELKKIARERKLYECDKETADGNPLWYVSFNNWFEVSCSTESDYGVMVDAEGYGEKEIYEVLASCINEYYLEEVISPVYVK